MPLLGGSRTIAAIALCLLAGTHLAAQKSPVFENDQVVIPAPQPQVEVPGFTHKMHEHVLNRVMIYLHPGGEILHFRDGSTSVLNWQAGQVLWSPASGLHYSEIPSGNPTFPGPMIVMIGVKKPGEPGKDPNSALDPLRVDPEHCRLEFENPQVRVTRVTLGPGESMPMHEYTLNHLVVYLADGSERVTSPAGKAEVLEHKAGEFTWSEPSKQQLDNSSDKPLEVVVVEFKS
jgi:quercetin dioxygenase-like cupin family protein